MPLYRLDLEYDGTDFHGWQVQPGRRTVQGELSVALERLCGAAVQIAAAGRTDAGVHALGQVASFQLERDVEPRRLLRALAALLPPDVHAWRAGYASPNFSARGTALARSYSYRMLRSPSPLGRRTHHVLLVPVDAARMTQALPALLGGHDFTAFAARRTASPRRECNIERAALEFGDVEIRLEITANRFLHNMVRRIAGCLVEIGRGQRQPESLAEILAARDDRHGGPCLPACGLVLVEVRYPPDPEYAASVVVDGPRWTP
jgi:tRNA pseudouridine38-40 synthase